MTCSTPRAALADRDILVPAPQTMTASRCRDLLGKGPAGADWLIADALDVEQIDQRV